jgi:hypothetical protein
MAIRNKKCAHPPCTCEVTEGKYCSTECEAMEQHPILNAFVPMQTARAKSCSGPTRLEASLSPIYSLGQLS